MRPEQGKRLLSLDALRGFDMFFIMGGSSLFIGLSMLFPCGLTEAVAGQMTHKQWDGFAFYDMIFPLFLFIAGVSFPFSYAKSVGKGIGNKSMHMKILRRGITLVLLGVVYNGLLQFDFANLRIASVLGRIGLAWMIAALLYVNVAFKARVGIAVFILLGYWALIALVPAPDVAGAQPFSFEGNLVGYIDRILLPGRLHEGHFDPEGILSTIPAVVTAMLGMMAGDTVKKVSDGGRTGQRAVLILICAGAALVLAGLLWNTVYPINKKLWSGSYVCFVGGFSFLLFALFYYVIDVKGWRKWTFFFRVIGLNSITIYMAQAIINFKYTAGFFGNGVLSLLPENAAAFTGAVFYIAVCWLFLYFLYRKDIFLKV